MNSKTPRGLATEQPKKLDLTPAGYQRLKAGKAVDPVTGKRLPGWVKDSHTGMLRPPPPPGCGFN